MTTANMRRARSAFRGGNLVYPSDIGTTMSRSKHYIQFFVNAQSHASARLGIGAYEGETSMDRTNSNVSVQRAPTKRAVGSIALYMPSQLNVSHKANYGEAEIGALVAGVSNAINTFGSSSDTEGVISALKQSAGNLYDAGTAGFAQKLAGLAEGAGATGAVAAVSIAQGKVTNNRTEMKFEVSTDVHSTFHLDFFLVHMMKQKLFNKLFLSLGHRQCQSLTKLIVLKEQ